MDKDTTHAGLDAHKETIHAAVLLPGSTKVLEDTIANTPEAIRRWVRRMMVAASRKGTSAAGPIGTPA